MKSMKRFGHYTASSRSFQGFSLKLLLKRGAGFSWAWCLRQVMPGGGDLSAQIIPTIHTMQLCQSMHLHIFRSHVSIFMPRTITIHHCRASEHSLLDEFCLALSLAACRSKERPHRLRHRSVVARSNTSVL